jgi:hypothetical protein
MATAKIPGGLYKGANGKYHDADGKPISDEVAQTVLNLPTPAPAPVSAIAQPTVSVEVVGEVPGSKKAKAAKK